MHEKHNFILRIKKYIEENEKIGYYRSFKMRTDERFNLSDYNLFRIKPEFESNKEEHNLEQNIVSCKKSKVFYIQRIRI